MRVVHVLFSRLYTYPGQKRLDYDILLYVGGDRQCCDDGDRRAAAAI